MVTAQQLVDKRRYFIVAAFILAAIVAPPEVLSQLSVALPLVAFYQVVIAVVRWTENGQ